MRNRPRRPGARPATELREELAIEKLVLGGRGLGRLSDGRTLFVDGAVPGDVVRLRTVRDKRTYAEALDWELVSAASERISPPCPDAAACGGCGLMVLPVDRQRSAKAELLREALERIPGRCQGSVQPPVGMLGASSLGYRQRVKLQLKGSELGFFAARSHELVVPERCYLASDQLWRAVEHLRDGLRRSAPVPQCETVEVRHFGEGGRGEAFFFWHRSAAGPGRFVAALERLSEALGSTLEIRSSADPHRPEDATPYSLPGVVGLVPAGGFVQVNAEVNSQLIAEVLSVAREADAHSALDLFCGFGNFSLPLAHQGLAVLGVEQEGPAIAAARLAAERQSLSAVFRGGDALTVAGGLARDGRSFDLVVVDPPRAGAKGLAGTLARLCGSVLVMVSCDPATLARDLRELREQGFSLRRVLAADMFPQTNHIEAICVLKAPRNALPS